LAAIELAIRACLQLGENLKKADQVKQLTNTPAIPRSTCIRDPIATFSPMDGVRRSSPSPNREIRRVMLGGSIRMAIHAANTIGKVGSRLQIEMC
jgi:hypothetical protein